MSLVRVLVPAVVVLAVALSGCGSSGTESASTTSGEAVSVKHRFGTTQVGEVPERIVALDQQWTDVVVAMGVEPVGYGEDSLLPDGEPPWWEDSRTGEPLALEDGVPVEQIAALEPDLIVGTYPIADRQTYNHLSAVAPTIAGGKADAVQTWTDLVETAGKILDDRATAREVVDSVESQVQQTADDLPGLQGKTFALAQYVVGDAMYVVADERDGSSQLFEALGMRLLPATAAEGAETGDTRVEVNTERVGLIDSAFLAFLVNGGDESDLEDIPGFDDLASVRSGAAAVLDYGTVVGINMPTPLSVPYVLDELRPYLKRAA